jgi:hypothetical protein
MKPLKFILALLILFTSFQICIGQEKPKLQLFDAVTEPNCEDLLGRLDNFAVYARQNSVFVGYVVLHGGLNPIENKFYETFITGHWRTRKLDENRFRLLTAKGEQKLKVEFWISRDGEKPQITEQKIEYLLPDTNKSYLFVEDSVEVAKIEGKLDYIANGACAACCLTHFNPFMLFKFLEVNPQMNAEILIYNKKRSRANQLINLIASETVKDSNIPRRRLKISYAGVDEGIAQLPGNISIVKVWLVPPKKK